MSSIGRKTQSPRQEFYQAQEVQELKSRLDEAEETLRAIRNGEIDALVVSGPDGEQVYTLQSAERPYRVLIEAMNEGALTLTDDGTILYCNKSFAAITKTPLERVLGSTFSTFIAPADLARFEALLDQGKNKSCKGEVALIGTDHHQVPTYLSFSPLTLDGEQGVSIVVTDLTEQKDQQKLIASEQLSRLILEQAAEATLVCEQTGRIIQASRRAHELCQCNPMLQQFDQVLMLSTNPQKFPLEPQSKLTEAAVAQTKTVGVEVAEEQPARAKAAEVKHGEVITAEARTEKLNFASILARKELRGVEVRFNRSDGRVFDLLLSAGPVLDHSESPLGYVVTLIDITENKKAQEEREQLLAREQAARSQAEEASRLKDEFLATISHELRTPLNAMLGWARLLHAGGLNPQTAARATEIIERNAVSQAQLIEDLLDSSRIITGKMRLEIQPLNLIPIIESILESVRPAADAKNLELETKLAPNAGPVPGDANRIQQIIWNLLSNAIKFTPTGGHVEVRLEQPDAHVTVIVSDTGLGISKEFLPFVFDRFRQADGTSTKEFAGLGLGLAIVRQLTEMHGGTVKAESEGKDKGATFTVKFPLSINPSSHVKEKRADIAAKYAQATECPATLDGMRVLVVEDEADTLELLAHVLQQCNAEVEVAASAAEGLAKVQEWEPDIIISDIGMPGDDGFSFIKQVRDWEGEDAGWTPAIALTAYATKEDRMRALAAGFQTHLTKPVEPDELAAMVASLVRQKSS